MESYLPGPASIPPLAQDLPLIAYVKLMTRNFRSRIARGSAESMLVGGLVLTLLLGAATHWIVGGIPGISSGLGDLEDLDYLTTPVETREFKHVVLERGEIESSSNIEVRCEVKSRSSVGINILEIVPEGTWVEEGDFLVRLDDAALQTSMIQQQIVCTNSESAAIEAAAAVESAKLALDEYAEGTYVEALEQQLSAVFVAEENKRRAEEYVVHSKRLSERGYIPLTQLDANKFALEKAKKELGVAKTKLDVLKRFTRTKMINQLRAAIQTAEAKQKSRQKTWELDKLQLKEIEEQIALCVINAPVAGQVVYENNRGRNTSTVLIEEGAPVRQRQTIINLPDPKKMRVVAKVHESRIGFIQKGQVAELKLDSMPEIPLSGVVTEVSEYPLPPISVYMAHVKEYAVEIEINDPPRDLRPGMTSEVNILVADLGEALQVPIEAVIERNKQHFCAIPKTDGTIETREIEVGGANETDLIVVSGLTEGDTVILNVSEEGVFEQLDLPESES